MAAQAFTGSSRQRGVLILRFDLDGAPRQAMAGWLRRLAAVGQMALSNYLFHSITASVVFLWWGFGLAGRFDYASQLFIVVAIWMVQLIVSPIWLQSFRYGPAEWLWRTLTYGRAQPMRQEARTLTPVAS